MLPTDYFHVTITVPQELRALLRANQRDGYALLMKALAEAIIELAHDRRFVGGAVGVLAVLRTWTQQLVYHRTFMASSPAAQSPMRTSSARAWPAKPARQSISSPAHLEWLEDPLEEFR